MTFNFMSEKLKKMIAITVKIVNLKLKKYYIFT